MWSAEYYEFEIRSDATYSQATDAHILLKYLVDELHFLPDGVDGVEGNSDHPWIKISAVLATKNGSFATQKSCPEFINLLSIVGSKRVDRALYAKLLVQIARHLGWQLVDNGTESGDEVIMWEPERAKP